MGRPTSSYSLEDLIHRVAREAGIAYYGSTGSERSMIPIDAHDLDLCKRIVSDGIKMFISDAPAKGWRWMRRTVALVLTATRTTGTADSATTTTLVDLTLADTYDADDDINDYWIYITGGTGKGNYAQVTDYTTLTGTVTVAEWLTESGNSGGTTPDATSTFAITPVETVDGDIHRYPLPENFGGDAGGRITYASDTSHASLIDWVDEAFIRSRRSVSVETGYPRYAAIRPLEPKSAGLGPSNRFEIILDPKPVAADTIMFPYSVYFDDLKFEAGDSSAADSTSLTDSTIANYFPDDYFNGWKIKIISGTGVNSYATVTDYTGSTGVFTVADWLFVDGSAGGTDPAASSVYVVEPYNNYHPAGIMFDEIVLSACLARAEMEIEDIAAGYTTKYMQKDLSRAKAIDDRGAPRSLGTMYKNKRNYRSRNWDDVSYS